MLNFCIFVFIAYFFKKVYKMVFPKQSVIHKGVLVAQCAEERERKIKKVRQKNPVAYSKYHKNKSRNLKISA